MDINGEYTQIGNQTNVGHYSTSNRRIETNSRFKHSSSTGKLPDLPNNKAIGSPHSNVISIQPSQMSNTMSLGDLFDSNP